MQADNLPHACLLCSPIALPFRNLWEARRHVREDHADECGDRYPEEFLRVLPADAYTAPAPAHEPPYACLHCQREGKLETRLNVTDIERHVRQTHFDKEYFNRMGVPVPLPEYGEDYLDSQSLLEQIEAQVHRFSLELETIRTTTDLFTEFGLGFYNDPPEDPA